MYLHINYRYMCTVGLPFGIFSHWMICSIVFCGYNYKLEYKPTPTDNNNQNNKQKNKRKRNITWFNPPYSKHVASNIGKQFLNLLDTCFPPTNKLHKILNRNTVKISYKCMPNMKQIISNHNKTILNKDNNTESKTNKLQLSHKRSVPSKPEVPNIKPNLPSHSDKT